MKRITSFFKIDFRYRPALVEKCIYLSKIYQGTERSEALRRLVFKMMKNIVNKNVANFLNLLRNSGATDIPEKDEVYSECYIIYNKCLEGYKCNNGYNFYMYFNKSLSRNFFKDYTNGMKREANTTLTDVISTINVNMRVTEGGGTVELLMETLKFDALEMEISRSKMEGQSVDDFLKAHPSVTALAYNKALKSLKNKMLIAKERGEL